jgi:hypothetical protein
MSALNIEIKQAIDSFDMTKARELLRDALKEADAETYYLASLVALDDEQKRGFLEKAVEIDPFHEKARTALRQTQSPSAPIAAKPITESEQQKLDNPLSETASPQTAKSGITVTAIVHDDAEDVQLYVLPINTSLVRTSVRKGAEVTLVERDDYVDYFRVLYASPAGVVDGWMIAQSLDHVRVGETVINPMDLPITEFAGYKRDDVKAFIKMRNEARFPVEIEQERVQELVNEYYKIKRGKGDESSIGCLGWVIFGLCIFIPLTLILMSSDNIDWGISPSILLFISFAILIASILGIWYLKKHIKQSVDDYENEMSLQVADWKRELETLSYADKKLIERKEAIKRLKGIEHNMRTDYEVMRDDQRRDMLMQAALNVGSTILTGGASTLINHVLPNNQTITHEVTHTHDKK